MLCQKRLKSGRAQKWTSVSPWREVEQAEEAEYPPPPAPAFIPRPSSDSLGSADDVGACDATGAMGSPPLHAHTRTQGPVGVAGGAVGFDHTGDADEESGANGETGSPPRHRVSSAGAGAGAGAGGVDGDRPSDDEGAGSDPAAPRWMPGTQSPPQRPRQRPSPASDLGRAVQVDPIKPELKPRLVPALETKL